MFGFEFCLSMTIHENSMRSFPLARLHLLSSFGHKFSLLLTPFLRLFVHHYFFLLPTPNISSTFHAINFTPKTTLYALFPCVRHTELGSNNSLKHRKTPNVCRLEANKNAARSIKHHTYIFVRKIISC